MVNLSALNSLMTESGRSASCVCGSSSPACLNGSDAAAELPNGCPNGLLLVNGLDDVWPNGVGLAGWLATWLKGLTFWEPNAPKPLCPNPDVGCAVWEVAPNGLGAGFVLALPNGLGLAAALPNGDDAWPNPDWPNAEAPAEGAVEEDPNGLAGAVAVCRPNGPVLDAVPKAEDPADWKGLAIELAPNGFGLAVAELWNGFEILAPPKAFDVAGAPNGEF
ncbi:hypothetical protein OGAPHI_004089 [Ogataea philodendri]|uniref:Uncharacterized protein n=1 Tax=Ogataea philodendri TaxID=1378263 RepID=A0A9P8T5A5_9ASCO|nr:uncharacterized protein OGAPHI_004089 [Ogataea philodendri]KAH3665900.1 hypothetical protein OGAPHI_004089 [Ogataea philodendri]